MADLRREFAVKDRKFNVYREFAPSVAKLATDDSRTSKVKEEGEDGYEEQVHPHIFYRRETHTLIDRNGYG